MRTQFSKLALTAGLMLAITFTFSCSSPDDNNGGGGGSGGNNNGNGGSNTPSAGPCPNATTSNGSMSCGGQTYGTVQIGEQVWMAKNLNYKTSDGNSRCYPTSGNTNTSDADNVNCTTYGRLYTWATAMALATSCNSSLCASQVQAKHTGACPSGWHLSSNDEWNVLMKFVNPSCSDNSPCANAGTKLEATSGWNPYNGVPAGTDDYGFSALPGGSANNSDHFYDVGNYGNWWTASEGNSSYAHFRSIYYDSEYGFWSSSGSKSTLFSIRCLKD